MKKGPDEVATGNGRIGTGERCAMYDPLYLPHTRIHTRRYVCIATDHAGDVCLYSGQYH